MKHLTQTKMLEFTNLCIAHFSDNEVHLFVVFDYFDMRTLFVFAFTTRQLQISLQMRYFIQHTFSVRFQIFI